MGDKKDGGQVVVIQLTKGFALRTQDIAGVAESAKDSCVVRVFRRNVAEPLEIRRETPEEARKLIENIWEAIRADS